MIDKAIRAEWLSTDLWSDAELLEFVSAKKSEWLPMMESALRSDSQVNLGDGEINSLTIDDVTLEGLAITTISEHDGVLSFQGELFHFVDYTADVSIGNDEFINTIEDTLTGQEQLTAYISIDLPLGNPKDVHVASIDYSDGLNLKLALEFPERR